MIVHKLSWANRISVSDLEVASLPLRSSMLQQPKLNASKVRIQYSPIGSHAATTTIPDIPFLNEMQGPAIFCSYLQIQAIVRRYAPLCAMMLLLLLLLLMLLA